MIESREQRKRSTLLHRRKVAIIASVLVVIVLGATLALLYNYFDTVIPFYDVDGVKYYIRKIDGVYAAYDENDNILDTDIPLGTSQMLYVTAAGTTIYVDPETGEAEVKAIPAIYYEGDGEDMDHEYLMVFTGVDDDDILSIEVKNTYGNYTVARLDPDTLQVSSKGDFVLLNSPLTAINQETLSYLTYFTGHALVRDRLEDPNPDFSEYGLVEETRVDEDGNEYLYTPSYYVVTTTENVKHKIIIGDRLIDGSGYYVQYENNDGVKRDAVYVLKPTDMTETTGVTYEQTILGPAKNYLTPTIIYPTSSTDYFEVQNFNIKKKGEDKTVISFSYIDLEDRTGTVQGIHPFVFDETSYTQYHPNYDNIDAVLLSLMDPAIVDIAEIAPTKAKRAEYGLMKAVTNEETGAVTYVYDPEYTISFKKMISDQTTGAEFEIVQNIYVSAKNEDGNYYTFTEIKIPSAADDSLLKGININMICVVSESTLDFLDWDPYDWVYTSFMQIGITYTEKLEVEYGDYSASFEINNGKIRDDLATMGINAADSTGRKVNTFDKYEFTDTQGNYWLITPQRIYVYAPDGTEKKPSTRHYEYNSIGEQVQVMDKPVQASNGDLIYVEKDKVIVGNNDPILRYHTTIFKKTFANINSMKIVDYYDLENEEEYVADESNHIITVKVTDENGETNTYSFYKLTARKAYITVNGQGGFYVQTTKLTKLINDIERFFNGKDVDMEGLN